MRSLLLWMARSERLGRILPSLPFGRRAVRRFMPGEQLEDAFAAADDLRDQRLGVLFTRLGENITSSSEADAVLDHYRAVLAQDAARSPGRSAIEISVKPTQLGMDQDLAACLERCRLLAQDCAARGTWFWLDMEGSDYTDRTLDLCEALLADHPNVGIAIQAYLRRSATDVVRLLRSRPAIRLVKGAYDEPSTVAYRDRGEVDASYLGLALLVAGPAARGEARLALGTHDVDLIGQIRTMTAAGGIPDRVLEVHMLYGIRAPELQRLRDNGLQAFTLVAYGSAWYRWYMRRLAERPANVLFALRQLLP
jgi:proline dehydrogenase